MTKDLSLTIAVPSKGRLMEKTIDFFGNLGFPITKTGHERGYQGIMENIDNVKIAFLSASEIAANLASGKVHMGVTGEDLIRENIINCNDIIEFIRPLNFGQADVIVAVPDCWLDVDVMSDLEEAAAQFRRVHGRKLRVATKYRNLTWNFFSGNGIASYRIVESLGATEGAPAAGNAEVIVDITSTGNTLVANHLRILSDGVILKSEANFLATKTAPWSEEALAARARIEAEISAR